MNSETIRRSPSAKYFPVAVRSIANYRHLYHQTARDELNVGARLDEYRSALLAIAEATLDAENELADRFPKIRREIIVKTVETVMESYCLDETEFAPICYHYGASLYNSKERQKRIEAHSVYAVQNKCDLTKAVVAHASMLVPEQEDIDHE